MFRNAGSRCRPSSRKASLPAGGAPIDLGPTAALVAHLISKGLRPSQVAKRLGVTKSTISFHLRRLGAQVGRGYVGRRVVCEVLGRSGVRAGELCDLKIGHLRLHDPEGARFRIPNAKTESGIREVQMSPDLVEAVVEHLERLRRMGARPAPTTTSSPTCAAAASTASASGRSSPRPPSWRASGWVSAACRPCQTPRRIRCAAPTSRSPCSPTTSTSSG